MSDISLFFLSEPVEPLLQMILLITFVRNPGADSGCVAFIQRVFTYDMLKYTVTVVQVVKSPEVINYTTILKVSLI